MYGPPHASAEHRHNLLHRHRSLHGTAHIEEEDEGGIHCSNGDESIENPPSQIGYDPINNSQSPIALASMDPTVEASDPHAIYASDIAPPVEPSAGEGGSNQLTMSFQGEVYVFDSVSPEKVQAVLLLLGGYEVPTGVPSPGTAPENNRNLGDYPVRSSQSQRAASLNRFREKRKERCFDKKIRYTVRKEVALRMQRKKGQFTSSKSVDNELGLPSSDWNGNSGHEEQETLCRQCGNSSKTTPMMRRGPDGPKTLCNACGLKWANKGRDPSKVPITGVQHHHAIKLNGETNSGNTVLPPTNAITSSSGDI